MNCRGQDSPCGSRGPGRPQTVPRASYVMVHTVLKANAIMKRTYMEPWSCQSQKDDTHVDAKTNSRERSDRQETLKQSNRKQIDEKRRTIISALHLNVRVDGVAQALLEHEQRWRYERVHRVVHSIQRLGKKHQWRGNKEYTKRKRLNNHLKMLFQRISFKFLYFRKRKTSFESIVRVLGGRGTTGERQSGFR